MISEEFAGSDVRQHAYECFTIFDKDGNRKLDLDELRECIQHVNANLGIPAFRARDVEHFMRRFDTNADNYLNFSEFETAYRHLLLVKMNVEEPMPFSRGMFLGRRCGRPRDHYDSISSLGRGSYGIITKVVCRTTKSVRVMKAIDKRKAMKRGLSPMFVAEEIAKLRALDHPAVLRLFEYFSDAHGFYIITDLLPGGDLLGAVEKAHAKTSAPLHEAWVRGVFRQVCEGVAYIHSKGVMHKDLKLDNVMLSKANPPEAVIIDVGLAEIFPVSRADKFHSADVAGTLATMAPEVIGRRFTYKCDIWSLGCCLFALLCADPTYEETSEGRHIYPYPFQAPETYSQEQIQAYVSRQMQGPNLERTQCSSRARSLILALLLACPKVRPTTTQVLTDVWLHEAGDFETSARDRTVDERTGSSDQLQPAAICKPTLSQTQLDCMVNFCRASALEEAILLDVASQLSLAEIHELRTVFDRIDVDSDGRLSHHELSRALQDAGLEDELADLTARRFTVAGSMEFSRFVAALIPSCQDLVVQHLRDAFNRLDTDGDGFVTMTEIRAILERGKFGDAKASQVARNIFEDIACTDRISYERLSKHFVELCCM
jgi:calcium-dependent protein kinase